MRNSPLGNGRSYDGAPRVKLVFIGACGTCCRRPAKEIEGWGNKIFKRVFPLSGEGRKELRRLRWSFLPSTHHDRGKEIPFCIKCFFGFRGKGERTISNAEVSLPLPLQ